ncbi:MAG: universal stress protein [Halobellus sp.]|uniref:universal stress protein n=1 Tax=Halobellus sp. TaxID=1979212 RepID=UPI0035D48443
MSQSMSVEIDRILVPLDGTEGSVPGLEHGISLAVETAATVHLVAVVDPYEMSSVAERSEVEAELEDVVTDAAARVQDAGVAVETAVETGFPHEELLSVVEREGIDLIAMGTHGRTGLDRYVLGSVAEKVVRLSPVPVLTVREEATAQRPYRNVVIPSDGSDAAVPAERWGVDLADRLGASIYTLSVVPEGRLRSSETTAAFEEAAAKAVRRVTGRATDAEVGSDEAVEHGIPHREILDHCERTSADLVVLGTHGRRGVERFVLGSVAEKVVRLSDTPVLVVPAE